MIILKKSEQARVNRTIVELKQWIVEDLGNLLKCVNRTIVELKQKRAIPKHGTLNCVNRTIVELKPLHALEEHYEHCSVLIEL